MIKENVFTLVITILISHLGAVCRYPTTCDSDIKSLGYSLLLELLPAPLPAIGLSNNRTQYAFVMYWESETLCYTESKVAKTQWIYIIHSTWADINHNKLRLYTYSNWRLRHFSSYSVLLYWPVVPALSLSLYQSLNRWPLVICFILNFRYRSLRDPQILVCTGLTSWHVHRAQNPKFLVARDKTCLFHYCFIHMVWEETGKYLDLLGALARNKSVIISLLYYN